MASYSSDQQVANATADAQMVPTGQRARSLQVYKQKEHLDLK